MRISKSVIYRSGALLLSGLLLGGCEPTKVVPKDLPPIPRPAEGPVGGGMGGAEMPGDEGEAYDAGGSQVTGNRPTTGQTGARPGGNSNNRGGAQPGTTQEPPSSEKEY